MAVLRIGCLAWGSLLWDPRTLQRAGVFRADGPRLPIEFSRVALDGRVTLVLDPFAEVIQTYWVLLAVNSLDDAVRDLGVREKITPEKWSSWIGLLSSGDRVENGESANSGFRRPIADWLALQELDAVVWTALPPRMPDGEARHPNCEVLLAHLKSLEGEARRRAEEYIRRAPAAVRTLNRARFESELGEAFKMESGTGRSLQ